MNLAADLVALLSNPRSYPHPVERVEQIETHISHVFLAGERVYKVKKPLRFDFLDYSTLALRKQACEEELRLNRRLTDGVYLDVQAVTRNSAGALTLSGEGEPVEWCVVMQRLREADTLQSAIREQRVCEEQLVAVAQRLAAFYSGLPPLPITVGEYAAELERHVRGNWIEIARDEALFPAHQVRRIHSAQLVFLHRGRKLLNQRVSQQRIVDGHGDLRPEHIYLSQPPAIVDCIEFNAEFRRLDILDELCFLQSECAALGAEAAGQALREQCLDELDDVADERVADYYLAYRACVRAKIALLRARQQSGEAAEATRSLAQRYFSLATAWERPLGPPLLFLVRGLSGSGKSTLARALAEELLLEHLSTDELRRELAELPVAERYSPAGRRLVYERMFARAAPLLKSGAGVLLDGTFLTADTRTAAQELANDAGALLVHLQCKVSAEVARSRIAKRLAEGGDASEAEPALVALQAIQEEPDPPGITRHIEIDMALDLSAALAKAISAIPPLR
jgi:aminoglycoside phosphotransferase family enzyme/predicted kinase